MPLQKPSGPGKTGRQTLGDGRRGGLPLGVLCALANRHDSLLLGDTIESVDSSIELPEHAHVHLDRAYDSNVTRQLLEDRGLVGVISKKGKPSPPQAIKRWVVERTNSWSNAHKKLVWCTEREGRVIDFWVAFSNVIIIVGRLLRKAWTHYRWQSRPRRRP